LYERLKTEQAGRTTRPFTQSDFAMRFERVYEQDMAWRNDQGGVTREQVRRMARINKVDLTEDEIEDAHREIKRDELWSWHDECLTQYAEETPAFVRDWSDQDGQFLIVTPKAAPGAFLDYISDLVELDEEELARLESQVQRGMSAGELFDQINGEREPGRKARRVGSVYYPVAADIWWAPDETPESAPNGLKRV
jgi:hypothetical protein